MRQLFFSGQTFYLSHFLSFLSHKDRAVILNRYLGNLELTVTKK